MVSTNEKILNNINVVVSRHKSNGKSGNFQLPSSVPWVGEHGQPRFYFAKVLLKQMRILPVSAGQNEIELGITYKQMHTLILALFLFPQAMFLRLTHRTQGH